MFHSITEFLAFFVGFRVYLRLHKTKGDVLPPRTRTTVFIACLFGALIGSRLLGGFEDPPALAVAGNKLLYFYQNKTVLGALLGGLMLVEIVKKIIGEKRSSGDLYVYPLLLALVIGRIGCFSMGIYEETYGIETNLPWGMDLGDGVLRHPVTLYEMVFLTLLGCAISVVSSGVRLANGAKFKMFLIAYLLFRFMLDFIKPHYTWPVGLSSIQLACAAGLIYYCLVLINLSAKTTPADA